MRQLHQRYCDEAVEFDVLEPRRLLKGLNNKDIELIIGSLEPQYIELVFKLLSNKRKESGQKGEYSEQELIKAYEEMLKAVEYEVGRDKLKGAQFLLLLENYNRLKKGKLSDDLDSKLTKLRREYHDTHEKVLVYKLDREIEWNLLEKEGEEPGFLVTKRKEMKEKSSSNSSTSNLDQRIVEEIPKIKRSRNPFCT